MTKYILALSLILVTHNLFSQEQFNNVYESGTYPSMTNVHVLADTGYASVGATWYNNHVKIDINFFDLQGNFIWNKRIGDDIL